MSDVPFDVACDSNPAKLAIGVDWLTTATEQQLREFVHHIAVNTEPDS